ncbi:lipoarabinomannan carrier protein LprG [Mycolicibacterium insubricum]|jgi:lipoprotein LprG|nr:lipoarabinomannan carrier protein LprG [Mycolicibacterium insubricum]
MQGMQTRRRTTALMSSLVAAGTVVALMAGCAPSKKDSLPDGAALVSSSAATTKNVTSAHIEIEITGTIEEMPVQKLSGDLTTVPATAAQGTVDVSMFGQTAKDVPFVVADGLLYAKITGDKYSEVGEAKKYYDPSVILDPNEGLANLLTNFSDAKSEKTEKLNGTVDTVKVSGKVSADAANKLLPQLNATAPIDSTVWISPDGDHNLVRAKISPNANTSVQVTLSNWNKPVTVTKPAQ